MASPFSAASRRYARDVVSGKVLACKWTRLSCERFLRDLQESKKPSYPYKYAAAHAEKACRFIELLPHIKGQWRGTTIKLERWQAFVLCNVFGWVSKVSGLRRIRTVYIEVPRKNAKSTICAGIALYCLAIDDEGGAECYAAATTRDQARIVFDTARQMALMKPQLCASKGIDVRAHNLNVLRTASKLEPLSSEGDTLDGLNIHFASVDELHAHKTRDVWDVLETGTGSRSQPLMFAITTAGSNRSGICYEQRMYLARILDRRITDETYWGVIYTIDDEDDWTQESSWRKANPNYAISVAEDDITRKAHKAMQMASAVNAFLTKHLNVWVNADTAWMDMRSWDACADEELTIDDFEGEKCWMSVDLASKVDIACRATVFERDGHYYGFVRHYLPEDAAESGRNSQYSGWVLDGRLTTTPGNVTDYAVIEDDLKVDSSRFQVTELLYDPFQATQFSTRMMEDGFPMLEMRPTVLNFSEPMKWLEALVLQKRFHHDGDPVLGWMVSNVVCHRDAKDNIYPRKEREENKIDGVVALIMCLNRAMIGHTESVYETRGVIAL